MHKLRQLLEPYRLDAQSLWLIEFSCEDPQDTPTCIVQLKPIKNPIHNRLVLARFYQYGLSFYADGFRVLCNKIFSCRKVSKDLPKIIEQDFFLRSFALGEGLLLSDVISILDALPPSEKILTQSIQLSWNAQSDRYYKVVGAPPTLLSKFIRRIRVDNDKYLLKQLACDLKLISQIPDHKKRRLLTLAVLSHGAAYRELEGVELRIPSFSHAEVLLPYHCQQHLIDAGVKTISVIPLNEGVGIYLCQGTELWPSQRSSLESILANFATYGSATAAYAHSWRRIHQHLRHLAQPGREPPLVAGHSMGGALAIQIMLYSHELIQRSFVFNPPLPSHRDEVFYSGMPNTLKDKLEIHANLDDFAFWRIGEKVLSNTTIWLSLHRYPYRSIKIWDVCFVIPAMVKIIWNLTVAFPAHQQVFGLDQLSISVALNFQEVALENQERMVRFDYLRFLPKLYHPMKTLVRWIRRFFGWSLELEYLQNELEIVLLHEQDLRDSLSIQNEKEIHRELNALQQQKTELLSKIKHLRCRN